MPVSFAWIPNTLKPGTYYARVVPSGVVRTSEIVQNIAERTLVQPVDVNAVLDAIDDEIVDALAAGQSVIVDNFLGFKLSLELRDPDQATTPIRELTADDVRLRINATVKSPLLRRLQSRLSLRQTTRRERSPQILELFDHTTKTAGQYTPGGVVAVRGSDLDLSEGFEDDPTQGVFFVNSAGVEHRAQLYVASGGRSITCLAPAALLGEITVSVRTTYGGSRLRVGNLEDISQA